MDFGYLIETLRDMDEKTIVMVCAVLKFVVGVIVYFRLLYVSAPYGRYNASSSFVISPKLGWFIQEFPSFSIPVVSILLTQMGWIGPKYDWMQLMVLSCFIIHYFQRVCIYPFLMKGGSTLPVFIMCVAFFFSSVNGYMQARALVLFSTYPSSPFTTLRLVVGISIFWLGLFMNIQSDYILRNLRKPGETGYKIPQGGLFDYVSCANYTGEVIEWFGFAVASWSLPASANLFFTVANIVPRALSHHTWYLEKFEDYPKDRKAVIPFVL